jgi:hypothetical protein
MTGQPSGDDTIRFNFLGYANRSGSTVFARRLASFAPSLLVVPEFQLPSILLAYGDSTVRHMSTSRLHQTLKLDTQLRESLMLEPEHILELARDNTGAGIRQILEDVSRRYGAAIGNPSTVVLLKNANVPRYPKAVKTLFPEARCLGIVRDGRAVANSLLRTPVLWHDARFMGRQDVYHCASHWTISLLHNDRLAAELPFMEIRYERLLADEADVLREVCSFLDVAPEPETHQPSTYGVSEREQRIHPLMEEDLLADRETAWKTELTPWHGLAIEAQMGRSLQRYGYELFFSKDASRMQRLWARTRALAVHLIVTPIWAVQRLWSLRQRPQYVLMAARAAVRRRMTS